MAVSEVCSTGAGERADASFLGRIALFSSLDDATLELLAQRLRVQSFAADATIFEEGAAGRAMFVVLSGGVAMFKHDSLGNDVQVCAAQAGDWFGEMALLDVMPRPATARATTPTRVLVLCPTDLDAVYRTNLKMYALLVMNMARQLSRKLRVADQTLACALTDEGSAQLAESRVRARNS